MPFVAPVKYSKASYIHIIIPGAVSVQYTSAVPRRVSGRRELKSMTITSVTPISAADELWATPERENLPLTRHRLHLGDARHLTWLEDKSVHVIITSPPYWTLKKYHDHPDQLGDVADYELFHDQLDRVWQHCYRALVPGGRLVCVVGDVCLARRRNNGRHMVLPLHADIAVRCRRIGFDYLTPILWHKIANASYEVENGSSFLGKPFEPNAIIKNDIEYILMLRKPGGYRKPSEDQRIRSKLTKEEHARWFRSIWTDIPGTSHRDHPAPFPAELAYRLIRMFSFVEDTVLDPFVGTGTAMIAAMRAGRHSIGNEVDPRYFDLAEANIRRESCQTSFFSLVPELLVERGHAGHIQAGSAVTSA
jgi:site-specific DNA-methyltransferase (adenine-specific)